MNVVAWPKPGRAGPLALGFTMAFQPIVDLDARTVWAHEALARGTDGAGAAAVLDRVPAEGRPAFDGQARAKAVELAARLRLPGRLGINIMPDADPAAALRGTLEAARRAGFAASRIVLEAAEVEVAADPARLKLLLTAHRRFGLLTAIDDFGAGSGGLGLLAEARPDVVKLDMGLTRGAGGGAARRAIVAAVVACCRELGIAVVAEGVETAGEMRALRELGVTLMQGFLFARPRVEAAPPIAWPA